jgi:hypothetical protein
MIHQHAGGPPAVLFAGFAVLAVWVCATSVAASRNLTQQMPPPPPGEFKPPPAPEQPIAYSHKQHLAQGLDCALCHVTARTGDHATLPPTSVCMGCHATIKADSPEIQKLKDFASRKENVLWKRVYRLADYVYWSHKTHVVADPPITCETCHGNVRELDVMQKLKDISMAACVECHKQRTATIRCDGCHEPRGL